MSAALFELVGFIDRDDVMWSVSGPSEANPLLSRHHYLGPLTAGGHALIVTGSRCGEVVAAQVWRRPTSRRLPADGTWLELSRWCLTPDAGDNAGSRMHRYAVRLIRDNLPRVTTLVSYSDPSQGHTGALYRACNWTWAPTWLRLRPPPGGHGAWQVGVSQSIKDRWVFAVQPDTRRAEVLHIEDAAAIRHWQATATDAERRWARSHPQLAATP
jgi:hypothetical protein